MPDLMAENVAAAEIYLLCRYQQLVGVNGCGDIDFNAVLRVIDLYNVKDKKDCFDLVIMTYREIMNQGADR